MAQLRKFDSALLLKCIVFPLLVLSLFFSGSAFQWIAVGSISAWLCAALAQAICKKAACAKSGETKAVSVDDCGSDNYPADEQAQSETELFLMRQINWRITEQLKTAYPEVSWMWESRPSPSELRKGGSWRIRICNAEPYSYAEAAFSASGALLITMLQPIQLGKSTALPASGIITELNVENPVIHCDVKDWYLTGGEKILTALIDDLNTQGHKKLLIHEDGTVVIGGGNHSQIVETIKAFPPKRFWDEFCQLLLDDEIKSSVQEEGLEMSW